MALEQALGKLDDIEKRYDDLLAQINDPAFSSDYKNYMQASKARSEIEEVALAYKEYKRAVADIQTAEELISSADSSERDFYLEERDHARQKRDELAQHIRLLLLPKDPNDDKNVILEIKAAAGGQEAALFASELYRMYSRYAERRRWKTELMNLQETGIGGLQEVTFQIAGQGAYSQLKFEGGVHRVQRVPATEASGRIHTSTVTVAVMPEADEVDIQVDEKDVEMDVFHSSSAGGQNVQKVATAIRLVHKPTGIVVTCQDERSQLQNKTKAWAVLRARLYELELEKAAAEQSGARRSQVGSGERSEKIRTYNFPDGRVTDHRIGYTIHNVAAVLDGDIQDFIDRLITADQANKLGDGGE
jgi:peptide chain release factor 1